MLPIPGYVLGDQHNWVRDIFYEWNAIHKEFFPYQVNTTHATVSIFSTGRLSTNYNNKRIGNLTFLSRMLDYIPNVMYDNTDARIYNCI